jgi:hypothetical protein
MSVKQVVVEKKDFPPLSPDGEYVLRYRVVSEDKNRTSHWSPIYKVNVSNFIDPVSGNLLVNQNLITIAWGEATLKPSYDVFVKFNFDIEHKSLTNNVASIVTKELSNIAVGDTIEVSGIDSTFNGIHKVTEVAPLTKTIKYKKTATNVAYSGANGSVTRGFLYQATSSAQTYSLLAVSGAQSVEALVQLEGIEKVAHSTEAPNMLKIYQSPTHVEL